MPLLEIILNFFLFYANLGLAGILIFVGKHFSNTGRLNYTWIILSAGVVLNSMKSLVELISTISPAAANLTVVIGGATGILGSLFVMASIVLIILERATEKTVLMKRAEELKKIIDNLQKKYRTRQLALEDIQIILPDLQKELAEIEVKLKEEKK